MLVVLLGFGLFTCGEKELTQDDLNKAEASLFNEDGSIKPEMAPKAENMYCKFVEQHPDDPSSPMWLYHAFEVNVLTKNAEKSIALCDQLLKKYPQSQWSPRALHILGSFVYEEQLQDLDNARHTYERILVEYPNSDVVPSVEASIKYLGMTPDEIMEEIMMSQMDVEEGGW